MTTATSDDRTALIQPRHAWSHGRALQMIQAEYVEMPGLALTEHQAARLWALGEREAAALLEELVASGFLRRTRRGLYRRLGTPRCC